MRFATPSRRRKAESVVPMINVVFLLLIFFLMSARIAPPPPFDLHLPESEAGEARKDSPPLYISQDGTLALAGERGDAVWQALATAPQPDRLVIRADAGLPASEIAGILARLSIMGITEIDLAVTPR